MPARNGKIAHLPNDIREQLNLRLLEGETARELAAWLNALPAVQTILGSQFNGSLISEVNLTLWRHGGYLQWLTERECFDSAHALADGDCNLASTGLTAERLLNIITLRLGQLVMYWDTSAEESVSDTHAFSVMARKARILQGICRSVLAIHRIQSQSARQKTEPATSSPDSRARSERGVSPSAATLGSLSKAWKEANQSASIRLAPPTVPESVTSFAAIQAAIDRGKRGGAGGGKETGRANVSSGTTAGCPAEERQEASQSAIRNPRSAIPPFLSGSIAHLCAPSSLPQTHSSSTLI